MLSFLFYLIFLTPLSFFFNYLIYYLYGLFFFFFFFFCMNFFLVDYFYLISYIFGMDSISYLFCCLSIWICLLVCLCVLNLSILFENYFIFYLNFLVLMLMFLFLVMDFFFFYFFFESSLIPVFLILFGWGYQPERLNAGFYLIFYTLFASLPFLLIVFYMNIVFGSFSYFLSVSFKSNFFMFFLVFSFLVKFPMFGLHNWLPKAHVEAPVMGSMILAGILLKLGGYGFIRLMGFIYFFIFHYGVYFISLSLVGCIFISLFCLIQSDLSILVAYSSVCHMSMVIIGLFSMFSWGYLGSLIFMLGHGFVSSGMFFLIGILYDRFGSRSFFILSGMINFFPFLSFFWFLFCVMNMSCPPSINLFSEIFIFFSMLSWSFYTLFFFFFILFFSACYSLMIFFLTQHGVFSGLLSFGCFCFVREYLVLIFHVFPIFFIVLDMNYFF
uniref:NADH dehydrogenase subunit 4 n=1 Tax=Cylindratus longicephalus TaxID=2886265 RepID=UPI001E7DDEA2|nr:NADH dehydrogenase subunit 4 [Cylindratus longicephalus]UDL72040.1 NADH dehydrogenase subunit 4 [Cylindratus longicephalus]